MDRATFLGTQSAAPPSGRSHSAAAYRSDGSAPARSSAAAPAGRVPPAGAPVGTTVVALAAHLLLVLAVAPADALGQHVYRWVDEHGTVHYGEKPPRSGRAVTELDIELRRGYPPPVRQAGDCQSIHCQYERLRADRLIREEALRKDFEARMQAGAAQEAAARAQAQAQAMYPPPYWYGGVPVYRPRPWPPAGTPLLRQPAEPSVRLRVSEGR